MVILGTLAVAALSAITARATVGLADSIFNAIEEAPRASEHTLYGHRFRCTRNSEYQTLESAFEITKKVATIAVKNANLSDDDLNAMHKFVIEGALLWGTSGMDMRAAVLANIADSEIALDVAAAVMEAVENLSPAERQTLFALHVLAV